MERLQKITEDSDPVEILKGIRHTVSILVWSTIGFFLVLAVVIVFVVVTASRVHDALCTFRGNLVGQVDQTDSFLKQHPQGLPKLGLPAVQLRAQEARQQASVDSLSGLGCSNPTGGS